MGFRAQWISIGVITLFSLVTLVNLLLVGNGADFVAEHKIELTWEEVFYLCEVTSALSIVITVAVYFVFWSSGGELVMSSAMFLLDSKGQPTTLKVGNCIGCIVEHHCLVLMDSPHGPKIRWASGDDKYFTPFIHSEIDFLQFAKILAETHGFLIKEVFGCYSPGPMYMFVEASDES